MILLLPLMLMSLFECMMPSMVHPPPLQSMTLLVDNPVERFAKKL